MATDNETSGRRIVSAELLIATLALLASAVASVATILQTRTIGNQLSASVWPYLTAATSIDRATHREGEDKSESRVELGFTNQGLGPAIVRSFVLTVDGAAVTSWTAGLARAGIAARWHETGEQDFGAGSVVRPGETVRIATFVTTGAVAERVVQAQVDRFASTVCYCSLLQNCWTLASDRTEPQPARACGPPTKPVTQ